MNEKRKTIQLALSSLKRISDGRRTVLTCQQTEVTWIQNMSFTNSNCVWIQLIWSFYWRETVCLKGLKSGWFWWKLTRLQKYVAKTNISADIWYFSITTKFFSLADNHQMLGRFFWHCWDPGLSLKNMIPSVQKLTRLLITLLVKEFNSFLFVFLMSVFVNNTMLRLHDKRIKKFLSKV